MRHPQAAEGRKGEGREHPAHFFGLQPVVYFCCFHGPWCSRSCQEYGELGGEEGVGEPVSEFLKGFSAWKSCMARRGVLIRQKLVTSTPKFLET